MRRGDVSLRARRRRRRRWRGGGRGGHGRRACPGGAGCAAAAHAVRRVSGGATRGSPHGVGGAGCYLAHSKVGCRVCPDHVRRHLAPVGERDRDLLCAADHVRVAQEVAVGREEDARPGALPAVRPHVDRHHGRPDLVHHLPGHERHKIDQNRRASGGRTSSLQSAPPALHPNVDMLGATHAIPCRCFPQCVPAQRNLTRTQCWALRWAAPR
jgi:hypothetical protein